MGPRDISEFESLVKSAAKGRDSAIFALWRSSQPQLLAWFRAVEPREADDLASETWVDALRSIDRFEGSEANFRSWLFTIGRRRLIDFRRRQMRRPDQCVAAVPDVSTYDFADQYVATTASQAAIARITTHLSQSQAEVILLRVIGGLDATQVAEILDRTPESVRVIQHRALRKLASALEPSDVSVSVEA